MQHRFVFAVGLVCSFLSPALGSYDGGYISAHDHDDQFFDRSYLAPPTDHHHPPPPHGHSAGSYYHYHVPVVGQQQHHPPSYHQDHSHYLWPLLLLLALPLLFLPLLPLLLLPLFISLLALLAPGGMMMMMMMMMMGGEMMMRRGEPLSGRQLNEMRAFGDSVLTDMTSLLSKYSRSLDFDQCPQRVACEMGATFFNEQGSPKPSTAKSFASHVIEQYIPKGKVKRAMKIFEKAFSVGATSAGSCSTFQCHPTIKIYDKGWNGGSGIHQEKGTGTPTVSEPLSPASFNGSYEREPSFLQGQTGNYLYPSTQISHGSADQNNLDQNLQFEGNLKTKRSHHNGNRYFHGKQKVEKNKSKRMFYEKFGTPLLTTT